VSESEPEGKPRLPWYHVHPLFLFVAILILGAGVYGLTTVFLGLEKSYRKSDEFFRRWDERERRER
jgi:hypothetical protein